MAVHIEVFFLFMTLFSISEEKNVNHLPLLLCGGKRDFTLKLIDACRGILDHGSCCSCALDQKS